MKMNPIRVRTKRLQKKLRTGDYQELYYPVRGLMPDLTDDDYFDLADRWAEMAYSLHKHSDCWMSSHGKVFDGGIIVRVNTVPTELIVESVNAFVGIEKLKVYAPIDNAYSDAWGAETLEKTDSIMLAGGQIN